MKTRISLSSTYDPLSLINLAYEKAKPYLAQKIANDPVYFPHLYRDRMDIEVSAFISAQFAYGNIRQMMKFLREIFIRAGRSPYEYVMRGDFSNLSGIYYRFHKESDIKDFLFTLREILISFGSIESFFSELYDGSGIREAIFSMREKLNLPRSALRFFFPERRDSNPLKRWNLFLRWMVRKDDVDFGIWKILERSKLYVPLDTHIFRIGLCLNWTRRKRPDFISCLEITSKLKEMDPLDPIKYDFFLCHFVGVGRRCNGIRSNCSETGCMIHG